MQQHRCASLPLNGCVCRICCCGELKLGSASHVMKTWCKDKIQITQVCCGCGFCHHVLRAIALMGYGALPPLTPPRQHQSTARRSIHVDSLLRRLDDKPAEKAPTSNKRQEIIYIIYFDLIRPAFLFCRPHFGSERFRRRLVRAPTLR